MNQQVVDPQRSGALEAVGSRLDLQFPLAPVQVGCQGVDRYRVDSPFDDGVAVASDAVEMLLVAR